MNGSNLESVLNTPKTFKIGDKEYSVKQFSIFEISQIRQDIIRKIKEEWINDMSVVGQLLNEKDRNKFLIEAMKSKPDYESEISKYLATDNGIKIVLSKALKTDAIDIDKMIHGDKDIEALTEVYNLALGIEEIKEVKEVKEVQEVQELKEVKEVPLLKN